MRIAPNVSIFTFFPIKKQLVSRKKMHRRVAMIEIDCRATYGDRTLTFKIEAAGSRRAGEIMVLVFFKLVRWCDVVVCVCWGKCTYRTSLPRVK